MKKKIATVLLCAALILTFAVGCEKKKEEPIDPSVYIGVFYLEEEINCDLEGPFPTSRLVLAGNNQYVLRHFDCVNYVEEVGEYAISDDWVDLTSKGENHIHSKTKRFKIVNIDVICDETYDNICYIRE